MIRKFVITPLMLYLIITCSTPDFSYAGGSGGEPLMSDEAGWSIVGALVVVIGVSIYFWQKQEEPSDKKEFKDTSAILDHMKTHTLKIITQQGNLIITKW